MDKIIYKATNLQNNKVYIGQTTNLQRRINEHKHTVKDGGLFHQDIQKFGINQFKFKILDTVNSDMADYKEKHYINVYRIAFGRENVYNITNGGIGGYTHDVSGTNNPQYGKHKTPEEKARISKKLKGKHFSDEHNKKISLALKGKKKPYDVVQARSHPIRVINVNTNEIIEFPSKAEAIRVLHTDERILKSGKITKSGYKLNSDW